ncbi:MAG: signal peptidase II [Myxococcales bacterium]|nr:signal peptidase II [Myxococcales bacterium]MCB9519601.1 signal peptidase II [Myxococcales bacterium]MCB9530672.1 signal peptidase II [Myxococcales bacterium]MCB9533593.1 signal peptidase II [Myxococcales bacterium]
MSRYIFFFVVAGLAVFADLGTKHLAEEQLASVTRRWDHPMERVVAGERGASLSVAEWVDAEFGAGTSEADPAVVAGIFRLDDAGGRLGPLPMVATVAAGDRLEVQHREVVIVPGFWNHVYVQNFGAAWGFLANHDERFVRPFFLGVALIAVAFVMSLFRKTRSDQKLMLLALPLIVGGAVGNFVDRARYGYVVDFIDWYVTTGGREHHWPTFNVADVWIAIGVGLMLLEIALSKEPAPSTAAQTSSATPSDEAA